MDGLKFEAKVTLRSMRPESSAEKIYLEICAPALVEALKVCEATGSNIISIEGVVYTRSGREKICDHYEKGF